MIESIVTHQRWKQRSLNRNAGETNLRERAEVRNFRKFSDDADGNVLDEGREIECPWGLLLGEAVAQEQIKPLEHRVQVKPQATGPSL